MRTSKLWLSKRFCEALASEHSDGLQTTLAWKPWPSGVLTKMRFCRHSNIGTDNNNNNIVFSEIAHFARADERAKGCAPPAGRQIEHA